MTAADLYNTSDWRKRELMTPADLVVSLGGMGPMPAPALDGTPIMTRALLVLGEGPVNWAVSSALSCAQRLRHDEGATSRLPVKQLRRGAEAVVLDALIELFGSPSAYELCRPIHQDMVRQIAARDVPMHVAVDALRFAQQFVTAELLERATELGGSTAFGNRLTVALSRCFDRFIDLQVADYVAIREQLARAGGGVRQQIITSLLKGLDVDARLVRDRLGVDLDLPHVACVVRPKPFAEYEAAVRAASSVAQAFGGAPDLRLEQPNGDLWLWFSRIRRDRSMSDLIAQVRHRGVLLGIGSGQAGAVGFRRSFMEAIDALRIAETYGGHDTVLFDDVALAVLLSSDRERCRWFVDSTLGPLAGPGPELRELRDTLTQYYASGHRLVTAAKELHVHRNTLVHRLERLAGLLGHPVNQRTAEVQAALVLCDLLGGLVRSTGTRSGQH